MLRDVEQLTVDALRQGAELREVHRYGLDVDRCGPHCEIAFAFDLETAA